MISYLLYRSASALARFVPYPVAVRCAVAIAFLFYAARPGIRRNVRGNDERIGVPPRGTFPVFRNFAVAVTDFLRLSADRREELMARCSIRGIEHLDAALARGKGAILFAPHLGPWELAGAYLTCLGHRIGTVALEHPSERVTRFFSARRAAWGIADFPARSCAGELLRVLERGESIVLLVDRNFSKHGEPLRFLGEETRLPIGHVLLAMRSGAPLVPCCAYYASGGRIEGIIGESIPAPDRSAPPRETAERCLERIEAFIREHPDQWFAFDHVWERTRHA